MAASTKAAKLHPAAHERLVKLQKELGQQGLPRNVLSVDILSALVMYVTSPQVAGMLQEYWRYTDELARAVEDRAERGQ